MKLEIASKISLAIDADGTGKIISLNIPVTALSGMLRYPNSPAVTMIGNWRSRVLVIGLDTNVLVCYVTLVGE